jgi:hypothetical protein
MPPRPPVRTPPIRWWRWISTAPRSSPTWSRVSAAIALLKSRLEALRADRLLAASLASSRTALDSILAESHASSEKALRQSRAKAFGDADRDLIYTPLPPCRLIDTRGFGAPIQGGPFLPNQRRAYVPAGGCGIPSSGVASLVVSYTSQNLTPASGGYLAIVAPNAPISAIVGVYGSEWISSEHHHSHGLGGTVRRIREPGERARRDRRHGLLRPASPVDDWNRGNSPMGR